METMETSDRPRRAGWRARAARATLVTALTAWIAACGGEDGGGEAADGGADAGASQDSGAGGVGGDGAQGADVAMDGDAAVAAGDAVDGAPGDAAEDAAEDAAGDAASDDGTGDDAASDAAAAGDAADAGVGDVLPVDDAGNVLYCGKVCADDELCKDGVCVANKPPCGGPCPLGKYCDPASNACVPSVCTLPSNLGPAQKVSMMTIAESSDGCDINGDNKPDNVFGKLLKVYPAANTELQKSVNEGLFVLLFDADAWSYDGKPFAVRAWLGELDASNLSCPPVSPDANCKYTVDPDNFAGGPAGVCQPQATVAPVTITPNKGNKLGSGWLAGGGDLGKKLTIVLPVVGGLDFTMSAVTLDGPVDGPQGWQASYGARICGVMTVADFEKALASVPPEAWGQLSLDAETVKLLVKAFLAPDIDLNKDGVPDAMSVALRFSTVPGQIVGVSP